MVSPVLPTPGSDHEGPASSAGTTMSGAAAAASAASGSSSATAGSVRMGLPRQRSKGQIARRHSITRGTSAAGAGESGGRRARSAGSGAGARKGKARGRTRGVATDVGASGELLPAEDGEEKEGEEDDDDDDDAIEDEDDEDDEECKTGGGAGEQPVMTEASQRAVEGDAPIQAASLPAATQPTGKRAMTSALREREAQLQRQEPPAKRKEMKKRRRRRQQQPPTENPWLGGLFFTDLIFIAFTYAINLLRTCGLAELFDVVFTGLVYVVFSLPRDLYHRWTLSFAPPSAFASEQRRSKRSHDKARKSERKRDPVQIAKQQQRQAAKSKAEGAAPAPPSSKGTATEAGLLSRSQLSPFHHLIVLVARFACANFPHLLPRVLFAEETIGPFVYWRTGGGSNTMVQEFTDLHDLGRRRQLPASTGGSSSQEQSEDEGEVGGGFKAYLLSTDARMPIEVQRANLASRKATTLLYLHGGGFSLGSVAFYAEALLRLRAKIAAIEANNGVLARDMAEPRCVAVEYDLSPTARFPTPLLQCLRCYAHLIEVEHIDPESICLAGDSAGGNLAMGMLLCLGGRIGFENGEGVMKERDWSQLPMPGKAVLISPWVDLRPRQSIAFRQLRQQQQLKQQQPATEESSKEGSLKDQGTNNAAGEEQEDGWTEAVAAYEWDYVASESLLHFAQVYAGILEAPRRVRGPLGWIAHVCGVFADEQERPAAEDAAERKRLAEKKIPSKQAASTKFVLDPRRALAAALARPSAKLARAAHDALSEPLLSKLLKTATPPTTGPSSTSAAVVPAPEPSAFEPLFTSSERRTDLVADTSGLFNDDHFQPSSDFNDESEERQRARRWLESHPLLSPTVADWSSIQLKHGCLVTWGERERMADDIELWVKRTRRSTAKGAAGREAKGKGREQRASTPTMQEEEEGAKVTKDAGNIRDDEPIPNVGQSSLPRSTKERPSSPSSLTASSSSSSLSSLADGHDEGEFIFSAIERGPGGVHAWPFVSMYLAGSESEREKGLDLVARFTAKTVDEQSLPGIDALGARPAARTGEGEEDDEDDDVGSVGSMPSDVDLHGFVVDEDGGNADAAEFELDQAFLDDDLQDIESSDLVVNIADAVKRAKELGIGLSDDDEQEEEAAKAKRAKTENERRRLAQEEQRLKQQRQQQQQAALLAKMEADLAARQRQHLQQTRFEVRQRGRSRSPRRTAAAAAGLTPSPSESPTSPFAPVITTPKGTASAHQPGSDSFFPPVQLHMPSHVAPIQHHAQQQQQQQTQQSPRSIQRHLREEHAPLSLDALATQTAAGSSSMDVSQLGGDDQRQRETAAQQEQHRQPLFWSSSEGSGPPHLSDEEQEDEYQGADVEEDFGADDSEPRLSDIPEGSEDALSPDVSLSSPQAFDEEEEGEEEEGEEAVAEALGRGGQGLDIGYYGLSQYNSMMRRHAEPEGLSDIAEEESNLSASITSAGAASPPGRNLSPVRGSAYQPQSLSAAVLMREQEWKASLERIASAQQAIGRREAEEAGGDNTEGDDVDEERDGGEELFATSPPSGAQPGPSIPLVGASPKLASKRSQELERAEEDGQDDGTMSQSSSSSTITRKKPKGDVWW